MPSRRSCATFEYFAGDLELYRLVYHQPAGFEGVRHTNPENLALITLWTLGSCAVMGMAGWTLWAVVA